MLSAAIEMQVLRRPHNRLVCTFLLTALRSITSQVPIAAQVKVSNFAELGFETEHFGWFWPDPAFVKPSASTSRSGQVKDKNMDA